MQLARNEVVVAKNLKKVYRIKGETIEAIRDISFAVYAGELVTIAGPSGCGKTTLLKLVSGLLPLTSGSLIVNGTQVYGPQPGIGMVFQNPVLLRWRSVLDNVMLPIEILFKKEDREKYFSKAQDLLKLVGLEGFEDRYPFELSGGMQQRASISRALIHDPPLLLMDEPFGALDAMTREIMNLELLRIWQERKKTVLFVTHSIPEAVFLADRVIVLSARPSRVISVIEPDLPRPRTMAIRRRDEFIKCVADIRDLLEKII